MSNRATAREIFLIANSATIAANSISGSDQGGPKFWRLTANPEVISVEPIHYFRLADHSSACLREKREPGFRPGPLLAYLGVITGETSRRVPRPLSHPRLGEFPKHWG